MEGLSIQNKKETNEIPKVKDGIDFVFEQNPELVSIGTKQQYSEYLDTIFPQSKVREIVWHYSNADFKNESFKPIRPNFDTLNSIEGVYNFSTNQKFVTRFGQYPYAVLLNIHQPLETNATGEYVDDMDRPLSEALYKIGKQTQKNILAPAYDERLRDTDAVINSITGEDYIEKHPVSGREIGIPNQKIMTVFDPGQIHILGSQSDIEGFKSFMTKWNIV
jgi:hypothetical protein